MARLRRRAFDPDVGAERRAAAAGETAGQHTLTEGTSAEYTERDAIAFFERSLGEARAAIASLSRASASADRLAAVTAAGSLRRSLRAARDHAGHGPAAGRAERDARRAELE